MTDSPALKLDDVKFARGDRFSLSCELSIAAGERVAVMGASGSGKSTLLDLIAGFEIPDSGRLLFAGIDHSAAPPAARPVSMLFQSDNLFAHLNAFANVALGLSPSLCFDAKAKAVVTQALAAVGLADKVERLPGELSGGERQRVALARVMVRRKPVLLLDEPFASLGPALAAEMLELVARIATGSNIAVILVTHDPDEAMAFAPRTVFLEAGQVIFDGPTDGLRQAGKAVQRYLGSEKQ